ncbi:hypothetical protein [Youngiibacter fragilis]|uniref:hypothetical protein n=1 Tax=Youngiibacter fragilis TaxID=1408819 RepID=UPI0004118186|nr:hypothetical protein [Youngiibacter fragilis]
METTSYIQGKCFVNGVTDSNYKIADIHRLFLENYAEKYLMGKVTYFYPSVWLKFMRDPHPGQTGENLMGTTMIAA